MAMSRFSLVAVLAATTAALVVPTVSAHAARIEIVGAEASSAYPPEGGANYDAKNLIDGKASSAWVEGDDGSGLGSWVKMDLGGKKDVAKIRVWGGMWYSTDFWERSNRPKELEVEFDDGSSETLALEDTQNVAELKLSSPKATSSVKLKIKGIHNGSTWHDTAISEVQVFDASAGGRVLQRSASASSEAAADADGNYSPTNVGDGLSDTIWCEGNKDSDGTGEHVQVDFGGSQTVSKLHLLNGIGTSMVYWFKGNRATKATLSFSDGSSTQVDVKNTFKEQEISFPAKSTSFVKITFDEVAKGKEYNDLCISEAWFSP